MHPSTTGAIIRTHDPAPTTKIYTYYAGVTDGRYAVFRQFDMKTTRNTPPKVLSILPTSGEMNGTKPVYVIKPNETLTLHIKASDKDNDNLQYRLGWWSERNSWWQETHFKEAYNPMEDGTIALNKEQGWPTNTPLTGCTVRINDGWDITDSYPFDIYFENHTTRSHASPSPPFYQPAADWAASNSLLVMAAGLGLTAGVGAASYLHHRWSKRVE